MPQYDGSIRINTDITTKGAKESLESLAQAIKGTAERISALKAKMDALKDQKIPTEEYQALDGYIKQAETSIANLTESLRRLEEKGLQDSDVYRDISSTIEEMNAELERSRAKMQELVDTGRAFTLGRDTQEYANLSRDLQNEEKALRKLTKQYNRLKAKQGDVTKHFSKMKASAKKAFNAITSGTKESSKFLSGGLKTILKYGLGIRSLYAIFNKIRSGIQAGFTNLMGYSDSFANSVQSVKNSMKTLGNQIAGAFRPIVEMVIPWLNSLISALTVAMAKLAQFIAVLTGKSTFTRAKQIQDKYNQSLNGTAKAADKARGALAKFDDLDVLEKPDNGAGGGGIEETLPKDMFEEVPVDMKLPVWLDGIIERLRELKDIFMEGFWDGLGDWESRWESIKENAASIKDTLMDIWTDPAVLSAGDNWENSVAYMFGSIAGSMVSIGLTIGTNLVGGIEKYLSKSKERIKKYLVDMFSIKEAINYLIADASQAFAYIFEAFGSEDGQELTANIIGIFTDAFMGVSEIAGQVSLDIMTAIVQPFIDNKDGLKEALEGYLGALAEVSGAIKETIDVSFDDFNSMYDLHIKPFFDSVTNGLSQLMRKFLDFWNESVQPFIDKWAAGFATLYQEHIQPMISNFIGLFGDAADFLKLIWEEILSPFIGWIIDNILPVILPIFDGIISGFLVVKEGIADIINSMITIFRGLIEFLTGVFTGDWEKAWNGVVKIFDGVKSWIKSIINTILGFIESMANGIINGVNTAIRALNNLHIDVPDWVTDLTGVSDFGFNISEIPNVNIPKLATGAVLRGGNPFMAIINDQPAGQTNIEAPLATIEQAVENVLDRRGGYGGGSVGNISADMILDGETMGRLMVPYVLNELARQGYDVDVLGAT